MNQKEIMVMMNAWVAMNSTENGDAYVVGYLQSILERLAIHNTIVLETLITHFGKTD